MEPTRWSTAALAALRQLLLHSPYAVPILTRDSDPSLVLG